MKAVYINNFGGPDVLELAEVGVPAVGPNQVLIKMAVASVNFADVKSRLGKYHGKGKPPLVPGLDVAGTVEAVGKEVKNISIGDRVMAFPVTGSYAEYCVADEILTFKIGEGMPFDTAGACPVVSVTAYNLLSKVADLKNGETVLIHSASGGVGTTAIQIAKLLGAKKVITTVGSDDKADTVKAAGADVVLNYKKESFLAEMQDMTNGKGADIILDPIGGSLFAKNIDCLADFGRVVCFGGESASAETGNLHKTCRSILGYSLGTQLKKRPETIKESVLAVLKLIEAEKLQFFISKKYTLSEVKEAHEYIDSRKSVGKILLVP
ncbi:zinc-binding dehydrogenase [Bacillus sp. FJAT-27251]|uniref:quinone oxidoreductase family protein n=1 Tax=Bacillus sp. FJAT-27251 TaxID=1684142 RepID=UPI0006A7D8C6|nr:zinc-binding dehydrogenase [Bacillus sp. FJAT-27251]